MEVTDQIYLKFLEEIRSRLTIEMSDLQMQEIHGAYEQERSMTMFANEGELKIILNEMIHVHTYFSANGDDTESRQIRKTFSYQDPLVIKKVIRYVLEMIDCLMFIKDIREQQEVS